jgi:hypothetical protein
MNAAAPIETSGFFGVRVALWATHFSDADAQFGDAHLELYLPLFSFLECLPTAVRLNVE